MTQVEVNPDLLKVFVRVKGDQLQVNPWQPRGSLDPAHVKDLAASIKEVGLLQTPVVRKVEKKFQIAFGHYRIEAIKLLIKERKWDGDIPVEILDISDHKMALFALTENRKRKDISPIEEYQAWAKALKIKGMEIEALAKSLGLDRSTVVNNLRVLELPSVVLDRVVAGDMTARTAREFLVLQNEHHCHLDIMERIVKGVQATAYRSTPDWRVGNARRLIRGAVVFGFEKEWRPVATKENDTGSYGYGGGAGREPAFDAAAFIKLFPPFIHNLPRREGDKSRAWTCNVKEWRRWQTAATREGNKEADSKGKARPGVKVSQADQILSNDPVVRKVAGVSQETVAAKVSKNLKVPTHEQIREFASQEHDFGEEKPGDDHPILKALHNTAELTILDLQKDPSGAEDLLTDEHIEKVFEALKLDEGTELDGEVRELVGRLVQDFQEQVAREGAKTPIKKLTEEQLAKVGTRSQVHKSWAAIQGFKHRITGVATIARLHPPTLTISRSVKRRAPSVLSMCREDRVMEMTPSWSVPIRSILKRS